MTERTTCVVVGGGPAGLVLGLLLARGGVEVTVLEKHADFLRDFRGDTVHPSTLQLLDELGLGERFAALPQSRLTEIAFPAEDGSQTVVGDLKRLKARYPYIAMVPQWDFLDLLAEEARTEPTFTLRTSTEVTGLLRDGGRVSGVQYRTADGTEGELAADLVVAADGRWSLGRREAGLVPKEFPVPLDAWWLRLDGDSSGRPSIAPRMRRGEFAIVIPREDYFQIAYIGPKGADKSLRSAGIERFRERIATIAPDVAGLVGTLKSMDDVKHLDVRLNRLHRWHVDGLLCIGDAAHAMSPIGGVGINLAVQDAVAAATLLAEPLRRKRITVDDLAKVRRRRYLPTVLVQRLQRILHHVVIRPVLEGRRSGPPKPLARLMRLFPPASTVPAYLVGIGFRPEHAPGWARRAPADV